MNRPAGRKPTDVPTGELVPESDRSDPEPTALTTNAGASPLEQVAAVLQLQVRLLQQVDSRQQKMEDALADHHRSDLAIQSTRSLNESFTGMRKVQEKLLDRLQGSEGRRRSTGLLAIAFLVLAAAALSGGGWLVQQWMSEARRDPGEHPTVLRQSSEIAAIGERLESVAGGTVSGLAGRLAALEERDRVHIQQSLERLERRVSELSEERDGLRAERDRVREELGAERARTDASRQELEDARARIKSAEQQLARHTERDLERQQLSERTAGLVAASQREERSSEAVQPAAARAEDPSSTPPNDPPPESLAESARGRASTEDRGASVQPTDPPNPTVEVPNPTAAADPTPTVIPGALVELSPWTHRRFNDLLAVHRTNAQQYQLVSAKGVRAGQLEGVVFEVRRADGSLDKTITAQALHCRVAPSGDLLEIGFSGGSVTFHTRVRNVTSRFFNDRYEIVVLGVDRDGFLAANLPFLSVR